MEEARERVAALERARAAESSDGPLVTEAVAALRSLEVARHETASLDARWVSAFAALAARLLQILGAFEAVMNQDERQRMDRVYRVTLSQANEEIREEEEEETSPNAGARLAAFLACHRCLATVTREFIAKLVGIGRASAVAKAVLTGPDAKGVINSTLSTDAMSTLGLSLRETLWKALLSFGAGKLEQAGIDDPETLAAFAACVFPEALVKDPGHAQDFAFRKLLLRPRTVPRNVLWGLVRHMLHTSQNIGKFNDAPGKEIGVGKLFVERARHVASIWSDRAFVIGSDVETLSHVSGALYNVISLMDDKEISRSGLLPRVITGVQHYLEVAESKIRVLGMLIAVHISRTSSPGHALRFEEVDALQGFTYAPPGDAFYIASPVVEDGKSSEAEEPPDAVSNQTHSQSTLENLPGDDHVANEKVQAPAEKSYNIWEDSSDDDDDDGDDDDEEGNEANSEVDSDDEEGVADSRHQDKTVDDGPEVDPLLMPAYLHDAVQALQDDKDHVKFQTCLVGLADLIRRRPADLEVGAAELAHVLVHGENRFSMRGFAERRMEALVALVVEAPSAATGVLIAEATQERATFISLRTSALEALVQGAQALQKPPSATSSEHEGAKAVGTDLPVQQPVGRVTRRWGQRRRPLPAEHKSRFAGLAGSIFFFPLLNGGLGAINTPGMREPIVLAKFLYALGSILAAAQHAPDIARMGRALFRLLWGCREHDDAQVRRSALFALAQVLFVVPPSVLVNDDDWIANLGDAREWAAKVAARDTDPPCREQAGLLLRMLSPANSNVS
ncbi:Telomere length regulation protein TEL2-like [Hondaea fermentalgiana]|uniref:Telomere length regulation protein TEL2-like n=1 Tax=Hondaea fermentalgiana TaxID=2315210 RepID=A0A2R5GDV4_9STRA|nr:Telomere length regulation protein TEL2-like [Hondaea fermentalgiana]|eukprot:GBG27908.1 Telomere length regulation protein TEL2-like [Hondaea fermentalgiana]